MKASTKKQAVRKQGIRRLNADELRIVHGAYSYGYSSRYGYRRYGYGYRY
jgi:hypothetical protein